MNDKSYLSLQFDNQIRKKNATEFQTFFEDIMEKANKDFVKIRPFGKKGDGGNDGYIPETGTYFQVYSPMDPATKDSEAAKKFKKDFNNLKEKWDEMSKIKNYIFVFNDKYTGSTIELERSRSELQTENLSINFKIFFPKDLEEVFFTLADDQIVNLGFDVDSRNSLIILKDYLKDLETELDKGNAQFVLKSLEKIKNKVIEQNNESTLLDFEILEAKAMRGVERVKEAKEKYENIYKRFPDDPRAPLSLAELFLNADDYDKNRKLLEEAEKIDKNYWLFELEKLIREYRLGNKIDLSKIDENKFSKDPKIKSNYYRIYSLFFELQGDPARAECFIEKAINVYPENFSNYDVRLSFLEERILKVDDPKTIQLEGDLILEEIEKIEKKFIQWGGLLPRSNLFLNTRRLHVLHAKEDYRGFEKTAQNIFNLVMECYFDRSIDLVLDDLLRYIQIPEEDLSKLLEYIQKAEKPISEHLGKILILQFIYKDTLTTEGKVFFKKIGKEEFAQFIDDLEKKNYDKIVPFILKDIYYAINLSVIAKGYPELREKIIENIPNDGTVQKEKLLLLLNYDQGEIDKAFSILKNLDLSKFNYGECKSTIQIAEKKEAWDFVIILLEKLLQYEKEEKNSLQMKLKLFTANLNLERFQEVINIGESILYNQNLIGLLDEKNKELILAQTIFSHLKRGQFTNALKLIKDYRPLLISFEVKTSLEAETYLKNNDPQGALDCIVEAIKIVKRPSVEDYGSLYFILIEIGNMIDFPLTPDEMVKVGTFVKIKDQDRWFFMGDEDELDAIKVVSEIKDQLLNKKVGERITLEKKYSSEKTEMLIENIFSIDKYIFWQSMHFAQKLSVEGLWKKMEAIEVPATETGIDPQYLIARLEDQNKRGQEFFDLYCKQNIPLALLAFNEGGLTNAVGRIANEQKGFINFSTGVLQEIKSQKEVAKQAISGQEFYIDGTSALILSEIGFLEKIYKFIPNFKVPQSVITLLLETEDKFRHTPGHFGQMRYSQGKINFSSADFSKRQLIQNNFEKSVKILEANAKRVEIISSANKSNKFSEEKIHPNLCDACVLAQRDNLPILTEDFLYLQMNTIETKKVTPKYFSAFALIRELYEQGKINFEEYLNFFWYLSSYRFRFLPITEEDLEKALFGEGDIKTIRVEELRKFNFPLTLSTEYGVSERTATLLVGHFLIKLIVDDSVLPEIVERVFVEIVSSFPTEMDRKKFGHSLLAACAQAINKTRQNLIIGKNVQKKINLLSQFIQIYNTNKIIIPNS